MQQSTSLPQFKKWTTEEELKLLEEFAAKKDLNTIAKAHDRSLRAIDLRLYDLALRMKRTKVPENVILEKTGKTMEQLCAREEEIEKERNKQKQGFQGSQNGFLENVHFHKHETAEIMAKLDIIIALLKK